MNEHLKKLEARLQSLVDSGDESTDRVDAIADLAEWVIGTDPQRGLTLSAEAHELAKQLGYAAGVARTHGLLGFLYYVTSDLDTAMRHLMEAKSLSEDLKDDRARALITGAIGQVHRSLGNFEDALSYTVQGLREMKQVGHRSWEAWLLQWVGGTYHDVGDFERSLEFHQESLDLLGELDEAEVTPALMGRALNGIGFAYQSMGDNDKALEYHQKCLDIFEKGDNKLGTARALNDIGLVYQELGRFDDAFQCYDRSLKLRQEVGNKQAQSTSLINLGQLYIAQKKTAEALDSLHRALTIAMEIKAKPKVYQANLALSEAHALNGDFRWALEHYKIYEQVKQEVAGDQANARIKNLQIGFEVEQSQKEAEISRLKNVELKEKNDQLEKLLNELQEAESQLIQSEKMAALGSLVAGIVHELNTPVGVINSALDLSNRAAMKIARTVENSKHLDDLAASDQFKRALQTLRSDNSVALEASQRISKICESLRSFTRLDQATFQEADIHEGLESTLTLLEGEFKDRITLVKDFGELPLVLCHPAELNQVFMQLLTNATKAIEGEGTISVRTFMDNGLASVEIGDTGIGIPETDRQNLFSPRFTKKGTRVKTRLGLFTAYNILQKHNGRIDVDSEPGKGSRFTVVLPADSRGKAEIA